MSDLDTYVEHQLPIPARTFVRCLNAGDGVAKVFGGFVLALPFELAEDAIYEATITFTKKLGQGRGATGQRLDQVMTGHLMGEPERLSHDPYPKAPPEPPPKLSEPQKKLLGRLQRSLDHTVQVTGTQVRTAKSLKSRGLLTIKHHPASERRIRFGRMAKVPPTHFATLTKQGIATEPVA